MPQMKMTKMRSMKRVTGSQKKEVRGVTYRRLSASEGWRWALRSVLRFRMERIVEKTTCGMA